MAGKRNRSSDVVLLRRIKQLFEDGEKILEELGLEEEVLEEETEEQDPLDGVSEVIDESDAVEVKSADLPEQEQDMPSNVSFPDIKMMSLDEFTSEVRSAFWNQFCNHDHNLVMPSPTYPSCIAVYSDFLICKIEMAFYKVSFTISDGKVSFLPRDQWKVVEQEWVMKSIELELNTLRSVKSLGSNRLGMYLVIWGDENHRDIHGEYFTKKTDGLLNAFKAVGKVPALYHHGLDPSIKGDVVGTFDVLQTDDLGVWAEMQIDKANKYSTVIEYLAKTGVLGSSSGTFPGVRKVAKSGEIERWVIAEGSITPSPADPRQRSDYPVEVLKAIYEAQGLTLPDEYLPDESVKGVEDTQIDSTVESIGEDEIELGRMQLELTKAYAEVLE